MTEPLPVSAPFLEPEAIRPPSSIIIPPLPVVEPDTLRAPVPRGQPRTSFANPILPSPSADPWVIQHGEFYYYCESRNQNAIYLRRSRCLTELSHDRGMQVWQAPKEGPNSAEVWAPELHFIDGRWFIYYAADDGRNENHRMWVLESEGRDPFGPYIDRGCLETGGWAIDGTVLRMDDGKLYFLWSGWPGKINGQQNIYIAPMRDPRTISGERVLICSPTERWETVDMAIAEGPQVLCQNGKVFVVYSASGSWTVDYCLGLLEWTGGDLLSFASWRKQGPVFQKTSSVWGVGHCSFVKSGDGQEDWIVYHAKSRRKKGWEDRNVRAQRFTWGESGLPCFGQPVLAGVSLPAPSGQSG